MSGSVFLRDVILRGIRNRLRKLARSCRVNDGKGPPLFVTQALSTAAILSTYAFGRSS